MNQQKIDFSIRNLSHLITKTERLQKLAGIKFFTNNNFTLTYEQMEVLYILYQQDDISQSELGKKALKDKANIARILRILEKEGFIKRKPATQNNRMVKKVYTTKSGRKEIDEIMPLILKTREKLMQGITNEQIENLKTTLEIYHKNIEKNFGIST